MQEVTCGKSPTPALASHAASAYANIPKQEGRAMGINTEKDIEANLQIGPTTSGMVRLFVEGSGIEIPMDFDPEEAEEIAEELRAAAAQARKING